MPNINPINGRYKQSSNADARNVIYRKIIKEIVADYTDCYRCRMLSFCNPKCVSFRKIVSVLNHTKVPTPAHARKGVEIKQYALIPPEVPNHLIASYRHEVSKIDTGVWDSIQVKRIVISTYKTNHS